MTQLIKAPWTSEQVAALNRWQNNDMVHPFTCGGPNKADHEQGQGILIATTEGWMCLDCTYTQDWAHDFMFGEAK